MGGGAHIAENPKAALHTSAPSDDGTAWRASLARPDQGDPASARLSVYAVCAATG